jgi:hypothetical protein
MPVLAVPPSFPSVDPVGGFPATRQSPTGHPAACPKCEGYLIPDLDGFACLQCGWVKYARPAANPEIPDADEGRRKYRPCVIPGCPGFAAYGGLCGMHDHRKRRHGDPLWEPPAKGSGGE